ncbi:MAG TPA: malto-oligosyltrehalose synthase [Methylomirabilota bacterium]|jgi:(1->4)-alpha-D-glucan 1-alpha-D-glucosylmutase|nr:malto-oligosyltrehalose synthase [Methylomirabilota bacterium]
MRVPLATYRLQLGRDFTFDDAAALLPYLARLGVSDCYTSPFFEAASENSHGYDVNDHNRLREELGGEPAFRRFAEALRAHGMGLLIDLVPNHMGIARNRNARWREVLELGPSAPSAVYFDIDWNPVKAELAGKVLLPFLGDQYGTVLDAGQLRLVLDADGFTVRYYDTVLPLAPRSWSRVLGHRLDELQLALGEAHPDLIELKSVISWLATIPPPPEADAERLAARRREVEAGHAKLRALLERSAAVRAHVEDTLRVFNGTPGEPHSFDLLDNLLDDQAYRVANWRVAGEEINYRRFFDINELAAIRMEVPEVFAETHRLIFSLVGEGIVTGLRVDHPDGLYEPAEYFRHLQRGCAAALGGGAGGGAGGDFYVVAEKILAPGEPLPEGWPTAGTTGYEFLNLVNGIFVDRTQARTLEHLYARTIRIRPPFAEVVYDCKRLIMETSMASEVNMLGHRLNRISEKHRSSRDYTLHSLTQALREIIAAFPVYRTYVGDGLGYDVSDAPAITERDREYIARAVSQAKRRTPAVSELVYDWVQDVLTLRFPSWASEEDRAERLDFVRRFQQITGPVTAKGYEDTVLYRFNRLVSLNEVGSDPSRFGTSLAEFHAENTERRRRSPHALSATATHDTKRGEDVRARINVLSEIPSEWRARVTAWERMNRKHRTMVDGAPVPGSNTEYLIYQTLVGAWPIDTGRLRDYMLKAVREAKVHTSWTSPNSRYDEALARFVEAILDPARSPRFLEDLALFHGRLLPFGVLNSLAQTLIKLTAPGVPDLYQGSELWDLSLVDPDNRRPVDWSVRRRLLDEVIAAVAGAPEKAALAHELMKGGADGRAKLFLIRETLAVRAAQRALFDEGAYQPLEAQGPWAEHVCAFARVGGAAVAITVVPRLLARRGLDTTPAAADWGETLVELPPELGRSFVNALTGERVEAVMLGEHPALPMVQVLAAFPVALLVRETM